MHTYQLYQPPVLHQRALVLDVVAAQPRLNLISHPLELLDLRLQVILELVLGRRVGRVAELFEGLFERFDADGDLLERLVDLGWSVSAPPLGSRRTDGVIRRCTSEHQYFAVGRRRRCWDTWPAAEERGATLLGRGAKGDFSFGRLDGSYSQVRAPSARPLARSLLSRAQSDSLHCIPSSSPSTFSRRSRQRSGNTQASATSACRPRAVQPVYPSRREQHSPCSFRNVVILAAPVPCWLYSRTSVCRVCVLDVR